METQELYKKAIFVIERYGRPPTLEAHLRKLGEEYGELAEAIATQHPISTIGLIDIRKECADVILVAMSLMELAHGHLEQELKDKIKELEIRIGCGKFDRKYGHIAELRENTKKLKEK